MKHRSWHGSKEAGQGIHQRPDRDGRPYRLCMDRSPTFFQELMSARGRQVEVNEDPSLRALPGRRLIYVSLDLARFTLDGRRRPEIPGRRSGDSRLNDELVDRLIGNPEFVGLLTIWADLLEEADRKFLDVEGSAAFRNWISRLKVPPTCLRQVCQNDPHSHRF